MKTQNDWAPCGPRNDTTIYYYPCLRCVSALEAHYDRALCDHHVCTTNEYVADVAFDSGSSTTLLTATYNLFPFKAIWLSLLPIAFGIALVAASDLSFTVPGFLAAALANCCFVSRSLLVKDVLGLGVRLARIAWQAHTFFKSFQLNTPLPICMTVASYVASYPTPSPPFFTPVENLCTAMCQQSTNQLHCSLHRCALSSNLFPSISRIAGG